MALYSLNLYCYKVGGRHIQTTIKCAVNSSFCFIILSRSRKNLNIRWFFIEEFVRLTAKQPHIIPCLKLKSKNKTQNNSVLLIHNMWFISTVAHFNISYGTFHLYNISCGATWTCDLADYSFLSRSFWCSHSLLKLGYKSVMRGKILDRFITAFSFVDDTRNLVKIRAEE